MCWGYRLSIPENARAEGSQMAQAFHDRAVHSGKRTVYLQRHDGKAEWNTARFGLMLSFGPNARLFWNAKVETLSTNESWARLMRQRVAIPVSAYVENRPEKTWFTGERAWLPGLINTGHDGGIVIITETESLAGGRPILLDQDAAMAWLDAKQWTAREMLNGQRVDYEKADIFQSARLDDEMKSRAPIAA